MVVDTDLPGPNRIEGNVDIAKLESGKQKFPVCEGQQSPGTTTPLGASQSSVRRLLDVTMAEK